MLNMRTIFGGCLIGGLLLIAVTGCRTSHEVDVKPVEIKPIHITIDINVKIDKALDDFFDDIDQIEDEIKEVE